MLSNWLRHIGSVFGRGVDPSPAASDPEDGIPIAGGSVFINEVISTRPDEIDCEECFEQLDHYAELDLDGKSLEERLPLVQDHLARCADCREEYQVLVKALQVT